MKKIETINKRIDKYQRMIIKFRNDNNLDKKQKNSAIKKLQEVIRNLNWVLN